MENLQKTIGANIKQRRILAGLTAAALGEAIGVTGQMVGVYERGEADISITTMLAICQVLICNLNGLLADYMPEAREVGASEREVLELVKAFNKLNPLQRKRLAELARVIHE